MMDSYNDTKLMLILKYGTMQRAWQAWCDAEILDIRITGNFPTKLVLEYISDPWTTHNAINECTVEYIKRAGFSDDESKTITEWYDKRNRKRTT